MGQVRFRELLGDPAVQPPLDEASLAIASALRPGLDETEWLTALELLAAECPWPDAPPAGSSSGPSSGTAADSTSGSTSGSSQGSAEEPPAGRSVPSPEGIAEYLFGELGFRGDRDTYYDWRNSCLDRVIARRSGIPISLSVVMIEVARRLGVELVGVGMPSHFLVGVAADPDRFFDPFDGGRALDREGARSLFESVTRGQARWDDSHLDPTPNREITIRMLNNLKVVFARRRDRVRYAIVMQLRSCIGELHHVEADELVTATAVFN